MSEAVENEKTVEFSEATRLTYNFPLRPDLNIGLVGIPRDITRLEVDRLVAFLHTLPIEPQLKKPFTT